MRRTPAAPTGTPPPRPGERTRAPRASGGEGAEEWQARGTSQRPFDGFLSVDRAVREGASKLRDQWMGRMRSEGRLGRRARGRQRGRSVRWVPSGRPARKSVGKGKSVSERLELGGGR